MNGDKAFYDQIFMNGCVCIPAHVLRLWLIGNYTCGSGSRKVEMMESQRRKEKNPEAFSSKHINNEEVIKEPAVMDSLKILLLEFK